MQALCMQALPMSLSVQQLRQALPMHALLMQAAYVAVCATTAQTGTHIGQGSD